MNAAMNRWAGFGCPCWDIRHIGGGGVEWWRGGAYSRSTDCEVGGTWRVRCDLCGVWVERAVVCRLLFERSGFGSFVAWVGGDCVADGRGWRRINRRAGPPPLAGFAVLGGDPAAVCVGSCFERSGVEGSHCAVVDGVCGVRGGDGAAVALGSTGRDARTLPAMWV